MAVTTWTAGQVLTAADLNDTLASKVDYALPTNAQTGTAYTFVAADAEKLTTASNGSAVTLTIPPASSVAWPDNTVLRVVNYGAGAVTIDGGSGVTVTNTSSTVAQYGAAVAIRTGSDAWTVVPFGGGDVPPATVSSPAATGQYTDGSGDTWDYYTFTASGTLTVDTAGFADVLVVGGGGAGHGVQSGGGGAGGVLVATNAYLAAGTQTVVVGAGGGTLSTTNVGGNGSSSRVGDYYAVGGGGTFDRKSMAGQHFGGSGGGGSAGSYTGATGTSGQGNDGGTGGTGSGGGGGGGASAAGSNGVSNAGGNGGGGISNSFTGSAVTYAGGGGGCGSPAGSGGAGGGGAGGYDTNGVAGTANTGGGGGGTANTGGAAEVGGSGGSGVVIVRVKV